MDFKPNQKVEISHDILAREVYARIDASEKMRLKVTQFLRDRYDYYVESGALLDKKDLDYIDPYLEKVEVGSDQKKFIQESRKASRAAQNRRRLIILVIGVLLAAAAIISFIFKLRADEDRKLAEQKTEELLRKDSALVKSNEDLQIAIDDAKTNEALALEAKEESDSLRKEAVAALNTANFQTNRAERQAGIADAQRLASLSQQLATAGNYNHAMQVAMEAFNRAVPPRPYAAQYAFQGIYDEMREKKKLLQLAQYDHNSEEAYTVKYSSDGSKIIIVTVTDTVRIWDTRGKVLMERELNSPLTGADFSRDDSKVVLGMYHGDIEIWDLNTNTTVELERSFSGEVRNICFAPDGNSFITASPEDESAWLWDLEGYEIAEMPHKRGVVSSAVFSPDGSQILTTSTNDTAYIWDLEGHVLKKFAGHTDMIIKGEFSPDGKEILTISLDGTLKLWDSNNSEVLVSEKCKKGQFTTASFSPTGQQFLTGSTDGLVERWTIYKRGQYKVVPQSLNEANSKAIFDVQFSPNGKILASASQDNTVKIWDMNGNLIANLEDHVQDVYAVVFSPDSKQLLSLSEDETARLYDLEGRILASFLSKTDQGINAIFTPDSQKIITRNKNNTSKIWDTNGQLLLNMKPSKRGIQRVKLSPDGTKVLTYASTGSEIRLWDVNRRTSVVLKKKNVKFFSAKFLPKGQYVFAYTFKDGIGVLFDFNGKELAEFKGDHTFAFSDFSPDGKMLLSRDKSKAFLWNMSGQLVTTFEGHTDNLSSSIMSSDGTRILTTSRDGTAKLWNKKGQLLATLRGHNKTITVAKFSPDGKKILTISRDTTAKIWDLRGNLLGDLRGHRNIVKVAEFSPDSRKVLTHGQDATARLWDFKGNLIEELSHEKTILTASFSPDGSRIITGSRDNTAKLWDSNGRLINTLTGHQSNLSIVFFSPDSQFIITKPLSDSDTTFRLWNAEGRLLSIFDNHPKAIIGVSFSPDGKKILSWSEDGTSKLWPMPAYYSEWFKSKQLKPLTKKEREGYELE